MRRDRLLSLPAAGLLFLVAAPAAASPGGWADTDEDDSTIDFGAEGGGQTPDAPGGGDSPCTWTPVLYPDEGGLPPFEHHGNEEYDWYLRECVYDDGTVTRQYIPVARDDVAVDPVDLRQQAVDQLRLPLPTPAMNPPDDQVVHVESWLWIDDAVWQTHTKSVAAGGVTVTVTAAPSHVVWDLGNGDTVTCEGSGTPYDVSRPANEQATDCSYTYRHSSAGRPNDTYVVTATVVWETGWTVTGADGGGPLPALTTTTDLSVRVAEMQALNQ